MIDNATNICENLNILKLPVDVHRYNIIDILHILTLVINNIVASCPNYNSCNMNISDSTNDPKKVKRTHQKISKLCR